YCLFSLVRSSTSAASHCWPSRLVATLRMPRPLWPPSVWSAVVWLYTSRCRPSASVTASIPEVLFGKVVAVSGDQDLPLSSEWLSQILLALLERQSILMRPPGNVSSVGWIQLSFSGSSTAIHSHVFPSSVERSTCTFQPPSSVLEPAKIVPSASCSGLFLTGPIKRSPSMRGGVQDFPPSEQVVTMPHHCDAL